MTIKVYYFPVFGRAEPIKMLLTKVGVEFEDIKVAGPEFGKLKGEGFFTYG